MNVLISLKQYLTNPNLLDVNVCCINCKNILNLI